MFGWKRKRQGFEWHEYVRTTILVRRAKRREHLRDVQQKAFGEVERARKRSVQAGVEGFNAIGQGARHYWGSASQWAPRYAALAGRYILSGAQALGQAVWRGLQQVEKASTALWLGLGRLVQRSVPKRLALPLAVIGVGCIAGSVSQFLESGLTYGSLVAGAFGVVAIAAAVVCWWQDFQWLQQTKLWSARRESKDGHPDTDFFGQSARWAGMTASVLLVGVLIWCASTIVLPHKGTATTSFDVSWPEFSISSLFEGERLTGRAKVLSGDTLRIGDVKIQLTGIETPLLAQTCKYKKRRRRSCGAVAAAALSNSVRRRDVSCVLGDVLDNGVRTGTCKVGDQDLAAALVESGLVFAKPGLFSAYGALEDKARQEKTGIWQEPLLRPAEFKSRQWETARKKAPDGCPIKGRALSRGKFYLLPWSKRYHAYSVRKKRGDRWFCSEREALQAGWKPIEQG